MDLHDSRPSKRRRIDHSGMQHGDQITRAEQLDQLTKFQQSSDSSVKDGIVAFKDYLASITNLADTGQQARQYRILKEYCESQKAPNEDQLHFFDLLSTWSFAIDNNAESLASAIPAALTQLLKTISGVLDLRQYGLNLIDNLLRRDQSKFFDRCLASPKTKPHLASPSVRLLTEMISFDAGARSAEFWLRRDMFMYKFDALLEQRNSEPSNEERQKPSVRRIALRLLLAMLQYLDAPAKTDLLLQARALAVGLHGLFMDGADIVIDILRAIEEQILNDGGISQDALISFFTSSRLERLAKLYSMDIEDDDTNNRESVRTTLQSLLVKLCTTGRGILVVDSDLLHSRTTSKATLIDEDDFIDLGVDSPYQAEDASRHSTRTKELAAFISKLKPFSDLFQSELVLAILRAAPELVATYTTKLQKLPAPSSDDLAWRAQFAFLFSIIESPAVDISLTHAPQNILNAVESIFPNPLDRNYVCNKLLSSSDDVLKMSGARLLTVAMKKLGKTLEGLHPNLESHLSTQVTNRLLTVLEARLPTVKDVSTTLQKTPLEETSVVAALLECLYEYQRNMPRAVFSSRFDIGPIMAALCSRIEQNSSNLESDAELLWYCVQIAETSDSTRWLHKVDDEALSPITRLLKLAMSAANKLQKVLHVIGKILVDRGVLSDGARVFTAFSNSFHEDKKFSPSDGLYLFVDNCISRASQKSVKYLDDIEAASQVLSDKKPLSLLVGALLEQWSLFLKKHGQSKSLVKNITTWIARLFAFFDAAGQNYRVMSHFLEQMLEKSEEKHRTYLQDAIEKLRKKPITRDLGWEVMSNPADHPEAPAKPSAAFSRTISEKNTALEDLMGSARAMPETLEGLDKWSSTDIDIDYEIGAGRLARLLLCTASPDDEIRLPAFQILQSIAHTIDKMSTHAEKTRIWLVLSEVCETVRQHGLAQPLPSIIAELSNALLHIMLNPVHHLYMKANKFVLERPSWSGKRAILNWMDKILHREATGDDADASDKEVSWLLNLLLKSLRSESDLDLYRRSSVWEKALSLYNSPALTEPNRSLILALLLRGTAFNQGTDMLWTRFGVHTWVRAMALTDKRHKDNLELILLRMDQTCSKQAIESWQIACSLTRPKEVA